MQLLGEAGDRGDVLRRVLFAGIAPALRSRWCGASMYSRLTRLCRIRMCAMPLSSARSERGFSGRCRSAIIAVLVTRGSATISVLRGIAFEVLAEDRVVVGDVRADQQDTSAVSMSS